MIRRGTCGPTWRNMKKKTAALLTALCLLPGLPVGGQSFPALRCAAADGPAKIHSLGATALVDAIVQEDEEAALALLAKGAAPNDAGEANCPPLYMAAGHPKMIALVKALVEKGAKLEAVGKGGTALVNAAYWGSPETVEYLISKGADVSAREPGDGYTALHTAAMSSGLDAPIPTRRRFAVQPWRRPGRGTIARILLEHGADVNAIGKDGLTPLDLALEKNGVEVIPLLRKAGGKTGKELGATRIRTPPGRAANNASQSSHSAHGRPRDPRTNTPVSTKIIRPLARTRRLHPPPSRTQRPRLPRGPCRH